VKILYIHGFGSCGKGGSRKVEVLEEIFPEVIAPTLPPKPTQALALLESLIDRETRLVGSSLGGFYALLLADRHNLPAVLINPSLKPWKTLKNRVGVNYRFCDGEPFYWKEKYLKELKGLKLDRDPAGEFLVLLQSGDEVLNYKKALKFFRPLPNSRVVVEFGGTHRFENLADYKSLIQNFLTN
jgi:predicted esterase YcpF (UPF0227 family)